MFRNSGVRIPRKAHTGNLTPVGQALVTYVQCIKFFEGMIERSNINRTHDPSLKFIAQMGF